MPTLRRIDPLVDCVFKAILGVQAHDYVLIDFLNSILKLAVPIRSVIIQNPYSELEFEGDKQTIVDVLAKDAQGRQFLVEIQLKMHAALGERMLYAWSSAYRSQLTSGRNFHDLRPTYAIWLMRDSFTAPDVEAWHYRFEAWDIERRTRLSDHMQIHVLQLSRWRASAPPDPSVDAEAAWLYFFKEAKGWDALPAPMQTPSMEKAMTVLKRFSENEADWHRYQAREHWLLLQATLEEERRREREESARIAEQNARITEESARIAEESARVAEESARVAEESARITEESARIANEMAQTKEQLAQIQREAEQAQREAEQAQREAEQAQRETQAERERAERLAARLRALGEDI